MKLLPSGETRITRSNRLNRSRCNVLRVLTNPEYLLTFMLTYRFSWSFIELPPREVLEQKREAAVAQLLDERIWENIGENFGE